MCHLIFGKNEPFSISSQCLLFFFVFCFVVFFSLRGLVVATLNSPSGWRLSRAACGFLSPSELRWPPEASSLPYQRGGFISCVRLITCPAGVECCSGSLLSGRDPKKITFVYCEADS